MANSDADHNNVRGTAAQLRRQQARSGGKPIRTADPQAAVSGPMDIRRKVVMTDDAARYVCMAKNTLEKLRLYGGGPKFLKLRRAVRYTIADLDAWLDERRVSNTSEADRS